MLTLLVYFFAGSIITFIPLAYDDGVHAPAHLKLTNIQRRLTLSTRNHAFSGLYYI